MADRTGNVLRGCLDNLPTLNSRLVRIFISSTFTDTKEERNILIEDVYPRLKSYCKEAHGLEFQVVDMRWGVPEEASDDHAASALCIQEIYNCQKLSTGPNFVAFLNQRHGYRPLQSNIPSDEFHMLMKALKEAEEDMSIFQKWYKEDTNASPSVFVLQSISSVIPEYRNKRKEALDEWENTYNELHWKLKFASQACHKAGLMNEDQKHKYFMSVTEEEIVHGILQAPGSPTDHCLCFIRIIEDLEDHLDHRLARRFIDLKGPQTINEEAQEILHSLRDHKVPYRLKNEVPKLSVRWNERTGINRENHSTYLKEFADLFYNRVKSMLDKAVSEEMKLSKDELFTEVLQHSTMAKERCDMFHGREEILDQVMEYISGQSDQPYTVFGPSGSGKTSILAKLSRQVRLTFNRDAIVILRFLGTSPESSNIGNLLRSICQQVTFNTDKKIADYSEESFDNLVQIFKTKIETYDSSVPLVIFLDSLDQLSDEHSAHKLRWLPRKLGKNVRMILSTYTDSEDLIFILKSFFPVKNFCIVPHLGEKLSFEILVSWLKGQGRQLTEQQSQIVEKAFSVCSLPLYVKLVFENVIKWRSYSEISENELALDVKTAIEMLFQQLEQKHGAKFVHRAFSYLTASMTGLSELELEDIMSLDDETLTEIFRYHVPPARRIPSLLWARLRHDINNYLVDKEVDETRVSFWYHRQFNEAASARYLSDKNHTVKIHSNLADYYLGIWYNQPKPFKYTEAQAKKLELSSVDNSCDRKVAAQPLSYTYDDGKTTTIRYNKRKLDKLPIHLHKANRLKELSDLCLFNYEFLSAKLHACSVISILSDFSSTYYDGTLLQRIIKSSQNTLQKFPESLAAEISGHLLPLLTDKKETAEKKLVTECIEASLRSNDPIPYLTCYTSPNEALLHTLQHRAIPYGNKLAVLSGDSKSLYTLADNNLLLIWDLITGELEKEMEVLDPALCKINILECDMERNLLYLATTYQQKANPVVYVDMSTSDITKSISLEKTYPGVVLTDWLKFRFTSNRIFVLSQGSSADVFDPESGKIIHEFDIKADDMLITTDGKKIVFHLKGETTYVVHRTDNFQKDVEFSVSQIPQSLALTPSGSEAVVLYKDSRNCEFLNIESTDGKPGKVLCSIKYPKTHSVKNIQMVSNGHFCLQIDDGFLLWNYGRNKIVQEFRVPQEIKPEHRVLKFFGHLTNNSKFFVVLYEWHMVLWDAKTGKLICTTEMSKASLELLLVDQKDEIVVTISKRQNAYSVWKLTSLLETKSLFSPLTLPSGPRYIAIPVDTGDIALIRGNSADEMVVVDLKKGKIRSKIAEDHQTYSPVLTDSGRYAILRAYTWEKVVDELFHIWDLGTGKFVYGITSNSLEVKHWTFTNSKIAVYSEPDGKSDGEISLWDIHNGTFLNKISVEGKNKGDMVLFLDHNDENILVSRYGSQMKAVATCDILLISATTGDKLFELKNVVPLSVQSLVTSESLFLAIQFEDDKSFTVVLDSKARKIVRKGQLERKIVYSLSVSKDGSLGLERSLWLYDLEKMQPMCQFDETEGEYMMKQAKNHTTTPKLMPDGKHAVWVNLRTNLLKIGNVRKQEIQSVCPIHTVALFLEVSLLGLIVIGCEDGRIMILQIPNLENSSSEGCIQNFINQFSGRLKEAIGKLNFSDVKRVTEGSVRKKGNSSKICALL